MARRARRICGHPSQLPIHAFRRVHSRLVATTMADQSFDPGHLFTPTKATSLSPPVPQDSPDGPPSAADGPPTSDDPTALLSPPGSPLTETDEIALVEDICAPRVEGGTPFYVEVPSVPEQQKTLYEPVFGDRFMVPDTAPAPEELTEIAGEHKVNGVLCYFARDPDRFLHRVSILILSTSLSPAVVPAPPPYRHTAS